MNAKNVTGKTTAPVKVAVPNVSNLIDSNVYYAMQDVSLHLKTKESWRGKIPTQLGFSKEDKEALNLITFAIMKDVWAPDGVNWEGFLPYVMLRQIRKRFTWDSKPSNKRYFIKKIPNFEEELNEYAVKEMEKAGAGNFARYIQAEAKKVSSETVKLYKAARTFATLVEYEEMRDRLRPDIIETTRAEILLDLKNFFDLPGYYELAFGIGKYAKLKQLIRTISCARYTFRWQNYTTNIHCNILTHMLESAMISYLQNLEKGVTSTDIFMKEFWVMLFHDIAEVWTDDIPGPIKDGFTVPWEGEVVFFRKITEAQEMEAVEENFIANLADESKDFFKAHMMDSETDAAKHKWYKNADYFAADWEVFWNITAGAKEDRYYEILHDSSVFQDSRTVGQKKAIVKFLEKAAR